jgi:mannosyltransferase
MAKKTKRRSVSTSARTAATDAPESNVGAPTFDETLGPEARPARDDERMWTWIAVGVMIAGAVLRFVDLGGKSLWFDEALSLDDSKSLAVKFGSGFHPPLFYALLHAWASVAGRSDAALRLVAAVPGALTLPALWLLARRSFGARAAAFATGVLAVASLHVEYSQEVRMYALATLFVTVAGWLVVEAVARRGERPVGAWTWALAYTATAYAAMATHYLAAFIVIGQALALLIAWRETRSTVIRLTLIQVPAIAGAVVVLLMTGYVRKVAVAADFFVNMGGVNQTIFSDLGSRAAWLPISLFTQILPGFSLKWLVIAAYRWPAVAFFDVCAVAAIVALARRREVPLSSRLLALLPALLPLPVTILMVGPEQLRFYIAAAPFVALVVGAGLDAVRPRVAGAIGLAGVLLVSSLACWWYFDPGMDKQPWRPVAALIAEQARPGDVVLVTEPHQIIAFEHYWKRKPGVDVEPYPEVGGARINPDDLDRWFFPLVRGRDRVWYVRMTATATRSDPDELALKWLSANMHPVSRVKRLGYNGDIDVLLFEK